MDCLVDSVYYQINKKSLLNPVDFGCYDQRFIPFLLLLLLSGQSIRNTRNFFQSISQCSSAYLVLIAFAAIKRVKVENRDEQALRKDCFAIFIGIYNQY